MKDSLPGEQDPQLQAAVSALIRQGAAVDQAPGASAGTDKTEGTD